MFRAPAAPRRDRRDRAAAPGRREADGPAVAAFLGSRSRLRAFTRHKLLELLAGKLDFASPALLLGVAREDGEDQRTRAREDLLDDLDDQVRRSVEAGAELKTGGMRLDGQGWFYPPTVLSGVRPGMADFFAGLTASEASRSKE